MQVPHRSSLVAQVVEILRRGIRSGEWSEHLPAERELCHHLQVSRPTIRGALAVLQREGFVQVVRGQRRRICGRAPRVSRPAAARAIEVLYLEPHEIATPFTVFPFKELEGHFHAAGYEMHVHTDRRLGRAHPANHLRDLVREHKAACWLLMASSASWVTIAYDAQ